MGGRVRTSSRRPSALCMGENRPLGVQRPCVVVCMPKLASWRRATPSAAAFGSGLNGGAFG
jgi:hypothetical protein